MTTTLGESSITTLGVVGGGQLGRMFVHAAQRLGFATVVLEPQQDAPAAQASNQHIRAAYDDPAALAELAARCDAITTEFENVPAHSLEWLAQHKPVAPSPRAVAVAQDRLEEKAHFVRSGVPCAPHAAIRAPADLAAVPSGLFPGILKTARMGYDGKGQHGVRDASELAAAWHQLGRVPCVVEQRLALAAECSVVLARAADGTMVHLPVQRNWHADGILAVTQVHEGNVPAGQANAARAATEEIASSLAYVGVLCVEFFILQDGSLVANEMAPRPHNSGHWSIDGSDVSQFELQVRTLAGLPLAAPRQHSAAIMLNLLGDLWFADSPEPKAPPWSEVLALPGVHLHLYGKREARPGRKMGHLTLTGADPAQLRVRAAEAARLLGLAALPSELAG